MALTQAELDRILGKQSVVQRAFEANQPTVTNTPRSMVSGTWADILKPIVSNPVGEFVGAADMQRALDSASYGKPLTTGGSVQTGGFRPEYLAAALGLTPVGKAKKVKTTFEAAQETAQRNATLPVAKGGLGLPANNTAMDRAKAMGFDTDIYRGENLHTNPIDINDYVLWASNNPTVANTYAGVDKGSVLPLKTKSSELAKIDYKGRDWESAPYPAVIENKGEKYTVPKERYNLISDEIGKFSKNLGHKGIKMEDIFDVGIIREGVDFNKLNDIQGGAYPVSSYAIFDPSIVRSPNAAFDPLRRNEPDLLAGVAAAPVGLLAVDQNKKKKTNKK